MSSITKELLPVVEKGWEPPVPSVQKIKAQIDKGKGRVSGSVRLATKRVTDSNSEDYSRRFMRKRKVRLIRRGLIYELKKSLQKF